MTPGEFKHRRYQKAKKDLQKQYTDSNGDTLVSGINACNERRGGFPAQQHCSAAMLGLVKPNLEVPLRKIHCPKFFFLCLCVQLNVCSLNTS